MGQANERAFRAQYCLLHTWLSKEANEISACRTQVVNPKEPDNLIGLCTDWTPSDV